MLMAGSMRAMEENHAEEIREGNWYEKDRGGPSRGVIFVNGHRWYVVFDLFIVYAALLGNIWDVCITPKIHFQPFLLGSNKYIWNDHPAPEVVPMSCQQSQSSHLPYSFDSVKERRGLSVAQWKKAKLTL